MKIKVLENIITSKYGGTAAMIWNMLRVKQKLDEKQVTKLSLLDSKTVRKHLYDLLDGGFAHLQDVPRTADHVPGKTFLLWYVHLERCIETVLRGSYKKLSALKQRWEKEVSDHAEVFARKERTDVLSGHVSLLDTEEEEYVFLEKKLTKLKIKEMKMQEMVIMLKEF
ncbi:RNA polymerase III subunit C82 [Nowakowskiella sp. JEL0078]|nr:RNA polymerase III subunit C82 [Nowakowskiella sp. JEL0078]